jgi:hypothetical protein
MASSITVKIPQPLYHRLQHVAARLQKPVTDMLVETLQAALPPVDEIPNHIQAEVASLDKLEDAELYEVAESQMADVDQDALEYLLDVHAIAKWHAIRPLADEEAARLESLRMEYGRVLLRKARAFALLAERGQPYKLA